MSVPRSIRRALSVLAVMALPMLAASTPMSSASTVSVAGSIVSASALDASGCTTGTPNVTQFPTITTGTSNVTTNDCHVVFGSSNDTSMLRIAQSDGIGNAMEGGVDRNGLVGWWDFDGSGADLSANANPMSLVGDATWSGASKPGLGQKLAVDGNGDNAQAAHIAAYQLDVFTVDVWFRTTSTAHTTFPNIVHLGTGFATRNFAITLKNTGNIEAYWSRGGVGTSIGAACTCADGVWHHAAMTSDATNIRLYLDGTQIATGPVGGDIDNPVAPLYVGRREVASPSDHFLGDIDRVRIYSRAFSPTEVQQAYQGGVANYATGTVDWGSSNVFGACLRQVTNAANVWSVNAGNTCPATTGTYWQGIPTSTSIAGSKIATAAANETNAQVDLRFGFKAATNQAPGAYVAPLTFEVVAPAA